MKKFLIAIAALTTVAATPAFATGAPSSSSSSLTFILDASVGSVCGVYKSNGPTVTVPFGDLAATASGTPLSVVGGSASYRCNSPVGFTRTIASANSGKLVRAGSNGDASNSIPFTMEHGGGSGLNFAAISLATNKVDTLTGSAAFLAGQSGTVKFNVNGVGNGDSNVNNAPGTTVFAGTYSDTVTISVTAS